MFKNIMDDMCKGCLTHERVGEKTPDRYSKYAKYAECHGYLDKDVDCICKDCLVKGMCDKVCEEYRKNRFHQITARI
jgi:hypothetical protein